jgi:hypothetical protein
VIKGVWVGLGCCWWSVLDDGVVGVDFGVGLILLAVYLRAHKVYGNPSYLW